MGGIETTEREAEVAVEGDLSAGGSAAVSSDLGFVPAGSGTVARAGTLAGVTGFNAALAVEVVGSGLREVEAAVLAGDCLVAPGVASK